MVVANEGHSQYCEWHSLGRFKQPFYQVNSLLINHSNLTGSEMKFCQKVMQLRNLTKIEAMTILGLPFFLSSDLSHNSAEG